MLYLICVLAEFCVYLSVISLDRYGWSMKATERLSSLDQTELPSTLTSGLLFPSRFLAAAEMIAPSLKPSLLFPTGQVGG